jgi:lipopolysaccharide transport system permease protein
LDTVNRPPLVIRPGTGWEVLNLPDLWRFRDLLRTLAGRDLKLRYRQTGLGIIWDLVQSLVPATIFSMIVGALTKLPGIEFPYFLFAFVGMLGWTTFANTLMKVSGSVVQDSPLMLRVYFPRLILPLATVCSTFVDFGIGLMVLPFVMLWFHRAPSPAIVLLPVWFLLLVALALGVGLYLSAIMVSYRDVKYAVPVLVQFLFYASPIAYPIPALPANIRPYFHLNPLADLLAGMRWSLLGATPPEPRWLVYGVVFTIVMLLIGLITFNRMERRFADVV